MAHSKRTLYISDLDGTLLDPCGKISQTSATLINHAIARGALFSVATARTPATVSMLLSGLNLNIPLVVMTGAALWDIRTGRYSDQQYFNASQVGRIIEAYGHPEGGGGFLYTLASRPEGKDLMEIYHIGPLNELERNFMEERLDSPYKKFFVPESGMSEVPEKIENAVLFFGIQPNATATAILEQLRKIEGINPMFYHDWFSDRFAEIEAFPSGATKAKAIRRLAMKVGAERIVVFGDNLNDLSMMEIADWSVAVANAVDEVKYAADETIGSNSADAVARYILEDMRL